MRNDNESAEAASQETIDRMNATCRPAGIDRWLVEICRQVHEMLTGRTCVHRGAFKNNGTYSPGRKGYVYVLQAGSDGLVKIGRAIDPVARLREIQAMSPVQLHVLALVSGTCNLESHWHRRFWKQRVHCEWFDPSIAEIFIEATAAAGPERCARCVIEQDSDDQRALKESA